MLLVDPDGSRADAVDGAIGELSRFHQEFHYYPHGVELSTARLPVGWRDRLVVLDTANTRPGRGLCLEPHDLVRPWADASQLTGPYAPMSH